MDINSRFLFSSFWVARFLPELDLGRELRTRRGRGPSAGHALPLRPRILDGALYLSGGVY
jgi:hypothetical protein